MLMHIYTCAQITEVSTATIDKLSFHAQIPSSACSVIFSCILSPKLEYQLNVPVECWFLLFSLQ